MLGVAAHSGVQRLHALYQSGDVSTAELGKLVDQDTHDVELIADLIETDGRLRVARGFDLTLDRYLNAIPGLGLLPDALDAAIDVVLRASYETGLPQEQAVEALIRAYPALETPIRESAALSNAIWSTSGLRSRLSLPPPRPVPSEFGPVLADGRPRYVLKRLLGEGAFGQVYLSVDRHLSEEDHEALVAIKILATPFRDPWTRESLIDEAAKARRVDHPHVVRVLDRNTSDGSDDFIVYEYVDGGDLAKWIRRQEPPIPIRDAVMTMAKIAKGVQAAHAAGLVHCDLKPGNIMLTADGIPKVADFGVSVRAGIKRDAKRNPNESPEHPIGNVAFIAPEQFRMEAGALSVPADIYALGGMLYLLLTGKLPNGSTFDEIRQRHEGGAAAPEPPSPRSERPQIGHDLDLICQRALAGDPAVRHRSAGEFADDLENWLEHRPIRWTSPSLARVGRLWLLRRPVVAGLCLILMISIIAAVVGFVQARIAADRAEHEEQWKLDIRRRAAQTLSEGVAELGKRAHHAQAEMLTTLWLVDMAYGPKLIDLPERAEESRQFQIEYFAEQVQRAHDQGREDDLTMLLWEHGLAFLLLVDRQARRASDLLETNEQRWRRILRPDDGWFEELDAMQLIADAMLLINHEGAPSSSHNDDLIDLSTRLEDQERVFENSDRRSPMHRLTLRTLIDVYGPDGLNDRARADSFSRELAALIDE